jgi:hypothetical protein
LALSKYIVQNDVASVWPADQYDPISASPSITAAISLAHLPPSVY